MTTKSIPCQAQDKSTCRYHGAETRANKALKDHDMSAYLQAQTDMAKAAKTSPDVKAFFGEVQEDTTPRDTHGDPIPTVDQAKVLAVLRSSYKGHRTYEREATAKGVMDIMKETNEGMHPWHEKHARIVDFIAGDYAGTRNGRSRAYAATDHIFLSNGLLVTRAADNNLIIRDERTVQKTTISGDQIKVGDVLTLDKNRFEVTQVERDEETRKQEVVLVANRVDRKPYMARAFVYETRDLMRYDILQ